MSIIGKTLKNIPWQDKPLGCSSVIWRHEGNPIIGWNPTPRTARIYNSSVVPWNSGFAGIFRADHKDGKARIHVGFSSDGVNWNVEDAPIVWHDVEGNLYEPNYSYDPRLVELDGTYYIVWCTDFGGASLGLGMTKDFKHFTRLENPFIPFNRNGVLFPRKIKGKYLLLSRPSDSGHTPFGDIFISESPDLVHWGCHRRVMQKGGSGWWQSVKIGAGAVPIETTDGWLLFYHGVTGTCNGFVYSFGAAILDIVNPSKVLYRTKDYLLTPEMSYETTGFVPNVVFPCAALHDAESGRIAIYYGAADTYSALAYANADELISFIKSNSELLPGDAEEYR
ncbi:glycoside hydrolase family 130 protein [Clostridium sp. BNL1100]|uniref:glycoside hydrolase family 130 protein n=1 Tax=Clostridium sp. BNL1100 TaxID=755731 RepID=UPI00024A7888|nr:glycoside hydrolase family 130 protein [Clostridium sp. BNL1100]AEY67872.1 putative glycosylase [Clostridium sp. BNL1100]